MVLPELVKIASHPLDLLARQREISVILSCVFPHSNHCFLFVKTINSHFCMHPPPAIFFVNADLNAKSTSTLQSQLYINDTMSDTEFDARVAADPNYPTWIHLNDLRILVIRKDFHDLTNRTLADVVIFVKQGMATILKNNFGPPGLSLPIERINMYELLREVGSPNVAILPQNPPSPCGCKCSCNCGVFCSCGPPSNCGCECPRSGLGGIFAIEAKDTSGVHEPNCDNECNNIDFINRK